MLRPQSLQLGYEPDPILARQQISELVHALNRTRITTYVGERSDQTNLIRLKPSEMQIELNRLVNLWLKSGPNVRKMFRREPKLTRRAQKGKTVFYPLPGGRGYLEWMPVSAETAVISPQDQALEYFMTLITNPLWEMLCGPCRTCKDFYLKKTNRPRVYCSKKCSSAGTAVPAVNRRREQERDQKIRRAQDAICEWGKVKRRLALKDWVITRTGYTSRWVTRALNSGSLRFPDSNAS
jgi:hypothetical protein